MATLNENSTSLAAANWSDGIGFATAADLILSEGNQPVVNDLDYSGITGGIESFVIRRSFNAPVGAAGNPVKFDADNSADARAENHSNQQFHYDANGGDSACNVLRQVGTGSTYVYGGTISQAYQTAGYLFVGSSAVLTDADIAGGRTVIENNATGINSIVYQSGNHVLKRDCDADGTIVVKRGATLTIDIPDASPTIILTVELGGRVIVKDCQVLASLTNNGVVDLVTAKNPITLGATLHEQGPFASLLEGDNSHTITAATYPFGFHDAGGAIPFTGNL